MRLRRDLAIAIAALGVGCGGGDAGGDEDVAAADTADTADWATADTGLDAPTDDADTRADTVNPSVTPTAVLDAPRYAEVGDVVVLDASGSIDTASLAWDAPGAQLDDGGVEVVSARWADPGRYRVTVTATSPTGHTDRATALVTVVRPRVFAPRRSGSIAAVDATGVAVVEPDAGALSVFDVGADSVPSLRWRTRTCVGGRTVAVWGHRLAVTCPDDDRIETHATTDGATLGAIELPWGSRPFGVVATDDGRLLVTLQGRAELATVTDIGGELAVRETVPTAPDPRGIALLPGGRAAVTRWRSPDDHGEITVVDLVAGETDERIALPFDPVGSSDTESGGVPTYLDAVAVSPDGTTAVVPSLQANIGRGAYLDGEPLTFETTLRAALSVVDLDSGEEFFEARRLFDDRGFASSAVFSPWGDYVYVTTRGARAVERLDAFTLYSQSGAQLDVGYAPDDVALSPDGALVLVHAPLSRELVVFDAATFGAAVEPAARLSTVDTEPLDATILRGKRLFNDSLDVRIAKDSYIACAHCHLDGEADRRTWDFTDRGEGVRNTTDLRGRAGTDHGPVHWSANFDEIQDFEHDIRGPFGGLGLMDDADFRGAGRDTTLGTPKAGVSEDLDALAAYVATLSTFPRSPHRTDDGALTEPAERGRALFESDALGCLECHRGETMTDSGFVDGEPRLHDVGTLREASGQRLGGALPGIDTPTLRGLWSSPPYLHDGSAETVLDVLRANVDDLHGTTSHLSLDDLDDLAAYLLSLE